MKATRLRCWVAALVCTSSCGGGPPRVADLASEGGPDDAIVSGDNGTIPEAGRQDPTTLDGTRVDVACPEAPCILGEHRCSGYLDIEHCVLDKDGCISWQYLKSCPTNYECHSFSRCENGECVEDPWPDDDLDDDGWCHQFLLCCNHKDELDCDDHDPAVHPGAIEVCDGQDNDCDGETDSVGGDPQNLPECFAFYADRDQDGHGDARDVRCLCFAAGAYTAGTGDDCDDEDPAVPSEATGCVGGCPDGVPEFPEVCDDGNTAPFDGCDSCTGERNYVNPPDMRRAWDPAVAETADGLVVAWSGPPPGEKRSRHIFAQFIKPDLSLRFGVVTLHGDSEAIRGSPALAARADGGFFAAWDAWGVDGDEFSVQARSFGPTGVPEGPEVTVNEHWQARQLAPALAVSGDVALLAWQTHDQDGDGYEVYARFLDVGAVPIGPEFRVNEYAASDQFLPVVAAVPGGTFAVAWVSRDQGPFDLSVVLTAFDAKHQVRLPETTLSNEETGTEVAMAASETVLAVAYVESRPWELDGTRWWIHVKFVPLDAPDGAVESVVAPEPSDPWDRVGAWSPALARTPEGFVLVYLDGAARVPKFLRFDPAGTLLGGGHLYTPLPSWPLYPMAFSGWPTATPLIDGRVAVAHECSPRFAGALLPHGLCLKVFAR